MNTMKNPKIILRIGLALVFLANALTAWLTPNEFREILESSFVSGWLPFDTANLIPFIAVNDFLVASLLLLGKNLRFVLVWAGLWITGVLVVIGSPTEILEESGPLAIVVALYFLLDESDKSLVKTNRQP